jgi:hypothetical protein
MVEPYATIQDVPGSNRNNALGMQRHWTDWTLQLDPVFKNKHVFGQTLIAGWESEENSHDRRESDDWNLSM